MYYFKFQIYVLLSDILRNFITQRFTAVWHTIDRRKQGINDDGH